MLETIKITLKTEQTLLLPTLPNFVRTESDELVPIESLTQDQIREIGQQWTEAFMRKAIKKRRENEKKSNVKSWGDII